METKYQIHMSLWLLGVKLPACFPWCRDAVVFVNDQDLKSILDPHMQVRGNEVLEMKTSVRFMEVNYRISELCIFQMHRPCT